MLERITNGRNGLWLSLALMLLLAMPGFFSLPPVDRDEVLFSQASRQMLASGDFVDIRFADGPRYKKPVGIYWLQAASSAISGQPDQIWSYRLVSLLGAMIAVGFTWGIARLVMPAEFAVLAAVTLAASLLMGAEARLATTDAMLLAATMAGQYVLARGFLPLGRGQKPDLSLSLAVGFWVAQAGAILIKGPIGPMVALFTLAGICATRRDFAVLRALRPIWGVMLLLALVVPWFAAISVKSDGAFWAASLGRDMIEKIGSAKENHGAPPGTYLALVWITFWPGSMLLAAGLPALWRGRREAVLQFAANWIIPTWIVFELTATKLVHYVLPTYPMLAILVVWAFWKLRGRGWLAALPGALPLVLLAAVWVEAGKLGAVLPMGFWAGALTLVAALGLILWAYRRGAPMPLAFALAAGGMTLSGTVYPTLARLDLLWPAKPIAAIAAAHPGCGLTVAGYSEPSLVFLTANRVKFVSSAEAFQAFQLPGCQVIVAPKADLTNANKPVGPFGVSINRVMGLDLGSGRPVDLYVYLKE